VQREPEAFARRVAQGQETGLCGTGTMSAGRDELHRALKISGWDRRILRRYFLIRPVIDTVAGELLPVAHRIAAESAIAVIDQQRPSTGNRRFYWISRRIPGCFWHDFHHNWTDSRALICTILSEHYDPCESRPSGELLRKCAPVPGALTRDSRDLPLKV